MRPVTSAEQADAIALIRTNPSMLIGAGLDLLDRSLNVIADLGEHLQDGEVSRANFDTMHGSFSFTLATQLAWGSAIVRPYLLVGGEGMATMRFNLGAYFTNTPDYTTGSDPTIYNVQGYDLLDALNTQVGDSYAVQAGVDYLTAIETILLNQGYTKYTIDSARSGTLLPEAKGWAATENATWLIIVNDLLSAIGYRGIFSDWDGQLVCSPYQSPEERATEWTYDDGEYTSELGPQQTIKHDFSVTPNRWVAIRTNMAEGVSPTDGDGIATYQNDSDGETSVEGRGRVITKRIEFEAADQTALQTKLMQAVAADKTVSTSIDAETTPNPLHWHFDILTIHTAELGTVKVRENSWKLPLSGGMMQHEWAVI